MMTRSESLSKVLELGLRLNSPDNVKCAKFILDYRNDFVEDGETVHYGMIQLYVETYDRIFTLDYLDFWDWYKNEESKCDFLKSNHRADQLYKQHCLAGVAAALGQGLDKADDCAVEAQGTGVIERGDDVAELGR